MALLDNPSGNVIDGRKTVTTAGVPVPLSTTSTPVSEIAIQALETNTGVVTVGASTVVGSQGTRRGIYLAAGEAVGLSFNDLKYLYVDSVVNGEGVTFLALLA